jgi:hypothetical protein
VGASLGPYVLDSTSLLSRVRVFWWDHQRSDRIEVPTAMPNPFAAPLIFVDYPGGNRIMAARPFWGETLNVLTLFYQMDQGRLQLACKPLSGIRYGLVVVRLVAAPVQRPILLMLESAGRRQEISGEFDKEVSQDGFNIRLITVKGDDVQHLLDMLADTPFPGKVELSVAEIGTDKWRLVDDIWTTGTVQPLSGIDHGKTPQPRSNPFQVMQTFCSNVRS